MREIEVNGSKVLVLPVIKGLVSEGEKVRAAILERRPDAVAISISKEELEGLRSYQGEEIELSDLEEAYRGGLEEFGEVKLPPPCYLEAVWVCEELGATLIPIDMNEELFSDRYCELIGGLELVKESFFTHRLAKKKFNLESAESFVLNYDRKVNGGRGISILNREREAHMAEMVMSLSQKSRTVLALVELERASGLLDKIEERKKV
jgi:pheromone shutdown protein TraB